MYHEFFLLRASWDFELSNVMIYWFASKNLASKSSKYFEKTSNPHAGGTYKSLSLQGASCSCQLPVYCRSSTGQCRWDNFSAFAQLRPNETSFNRCMAAKLAVRKAWITLGGHLATENWNSKRANVWELIWEPWKDVYYNRFVENSF